MKIVLIRHGKHDSINGKLIGDGKKQAKLLAKKAKKFDVYQIYSSDLDRAKETAEFLQKRLKLPILITPLLREFDTEEIKKINKKTRDKIKKLNKLMDEIIKKKKNVMIVAHGMTNKLIISYLMKLDPVKLIPFMQDNTCVNVLEWNQAFKNWRLTLLNDTSHLDKNLQKFEDKYRK